MRLHRQEFNNNESLLMKKNKRHPTLTATILLDTFVPIKKALKSAFFMQSKRIFLSLLLLTSLFSDEIKDGLVKEYHPNGQLKSEIIYKDGKENGPYKWYFQNGQLQSEEIFKNDVSVGPFKYYYENGQVRLEGKLTDNGPDGVQRTYNKEGILTSEHTWKDGELIESKEYH